MPEGLDHLYSVTLHVTAVNHDHIEFPFWEAIPLFLGIFLSLAINSGRIKDKAAFASFFPNAAFFVLRVGDEEAEAEDD